MANKQYPNQGAVTSVNGSTGDVTVAGSYYAADTGSVNALAVALTGTPSIVAGLIIAVKVAVTNTSGVTINVDSTGAVNVYKADGATALTAGDIVAGQIIELAFDGTYWQLQSPPAVVSTLQKNPVDSTVLGSGQDGYVATWQNSASKIQFKSLTSIGSANASQLRGVTISTVTPQTGDTLRYNEYGGSTWDLANGMPHFLKIYCDIYNASILAIGMNTGVTQLGTISRVVATATEPPSMKSAGAATASTSVVCGCYIISGGTCPLTFGIIKRFTARAFMMQTANCRFWAGMTDNTSPSGTTFASDTPAANFVGFRYSAGTDSSIAAVCQTSAGNQTVVSTGVAVNTSASQLFEVAFDGTNYNFFINGTLVAQISTHVPTAATAMTPVLLGDNKNTNNAVAWTLVYMIVTMK